MNNLVRRLALVGCMMVSVAGCAGIGTGNGENAPELPAAAGSDKPSGTANPEAAKAQTNERGLIVKQLCEMACFGGTDKNCDGGVSFAIDKIEVDPPCTEFAAGSGPTRPDPTDGMSRDPWPGKEVAGGA